MEYLLDPCSDRKVPSVPLPIHSRHPLSDALLYPSRNPLLTRFIEHKGTPRGSSAKTGTMPDWQLAKDYL